MGLLDVANHLLNFVAPAMAVATLALLVQRVLGPRMPARPAWAAQWLVTVLVGCATLLLGLLVLGRDGKMLTYAALVLACATSQWVLGRGWKP